MKYDEWICLLVWNLCMAVTLSALTTQFPMTDAKWDDPEEWN